MFEILWQMTSRDTEDVFGILREDETFLSTVLLPAIDGVSILYESCIFRKDGSEVLARYASEEAATAGHNRLAKKYNLR
jgi:hypothetical protein